MKSFYGGLLGFFGGAVLGFAAPVIVFFLFLAITPEEKKKEAWQAGTPFAIMMPLTAISGAGVGIVLGVNRAKTGRWQITDEVVDELPGPQIRNDKFTVGGVIKNHAARSLAPERIEWFDQQLLLKEEVDIEKARIGFLNHAIGDYRVLMRGKLKGIAVYLFLSCLLWFIFLPLTLVKVYQAFIQRRSMQDRLQAVAYAWQIDIAESLDELPVSL